MLSAGPAEPWIFNAVSPPLFSLVLETVVGGVKKVFEARTEGTKRRGRPGIEREKYIRVCKRAVLSKDSMIIR